MNADFQFDAFLSHNSSDKARVRPLAERLRDNGFRIWYDDWEIEPGDDVFLKIEQGLEGSRILILVMSPNSFGSDWVTMERNTSLFRDPVNTQRRFIPLLLEDCKIPDTIGRLRYIDWRKEDEEQFAILKRAIGPPAEPVSKATKTTGLYRLTEVSPEVLEMRTRISPSEGLDPKPNVGTGETLLWQLFSFPNGGSPQKLLYSNDMLFVSNWASSNIMMIDPKRKNVIDVLELDYYEAGNLALPAERSKFGQSAIIRRYPPGDIAAASKKLFVGQVFSEFVLAIDIDSRTIVKRIPIGGEGSLVNSPDDKEIYFASNKTNAFYIVDAETYQIEAVKYPGLGRGSGSIFAHPTSQTLYIGIQRGGSIDGRTLRGGNSFIAIYDLAKRDYTGTIYLAEAQGDTSDDSWPVCMTYSPEDELLYVGMIQSRRGIRIIDTKNNRLVGDIAFEPNQGQRPFAWVDPLGQALYERYLLSVNRNNYELVVLDRESRQQLIAVPLGGSGNGPNKVVVVDDEAIISHSEYDGLIFADLKAITKKTG